MGAVTALQIESITKDVSGALWLLTMGYGVLKFDPKKGKFDEYPALVPSRKIQAIYCTKEGDLIVNTEDKGVYRTTVELKSATQIVLPSKKQFTCRRAKNYSVYRW